MIRNWHPGAERTPKGYYKNLSVVLRVDPFTLEVKGTPRQQTSQQEGQKDGQQEGQEGQRGQGLEPQGGGQGDGQQEGQGQVQVQTATVGDAFL